MIKKYPMVQTLNGLFLTDSQRKSIPPLRMDDEDWKAFLALIQINKVTVRTLQKMLDQGANLPEDAEKALSLAQKKKQQKLQIIQEVDSIFSDNGIKYVLLKFRESLPDLGRDTDYLLGSKFKEADRLIRSNFPSARPISLSLSDRLCKSKSSFFIGEVELELYGRITQIGEDYFQCDKIIQKASIITIDGLCVPVPSIEDNLLITCVHAMYRHRRIKYSELLVAVRAVSSDQVDWDYVFKTASEIGVLPGLVFFLSTAKRLLHQAANHPETLPAELSWTMNFPASVPVLKVDQFYLRKFISELENLRLSSASRVGLIPFIAVFAELSQKIGLGVRIW